MATRLQISLLAVFALPLFGAGLSHPGEVQRTIPCPGPCPTGLAATKERLYVVDRFTDLVYCLDRTSGKVVRRFAAPCFQPFGLALDGKGGLWVAEDVAERETDRLYRIDLESGEVNRSVPLPLDHVRSLAWQAGALWVGTRKGQLALVDPADGSVLRNAPVPSKRITGLAHDGHYLWSGDRGTDRIYLIDPASGEVVFVLPAPGPALSGLACAGGQLYVLDYEKRLIHEVRTRGKRSTWTVNPRRQRLCYRVVMHNRGNGPATRLTAWIAVPKNTVRQKLLGRIRWEPSPAGFEKDDWGQELARFEFTNVPPGASVEARMHLDVELRALWRAIYPEDVKGLAEIPVKVRNRYLKGGNKYQLHDPFLRQLAAKAVGGEKNPWWIARKLSRAVGERMSYELAGGWEPAPVVLKRGSGSCSEYTFAFLALCRLAGVPARYVGSIVVRGEAGSCDQTFHRWAQVYLPGQGWVDWDVQAADSPWRGTCAEKLCFRGNHRLTTTYGGGPSSVLVWEYNGQHRIRVKGQANILVEKYGEWSPLR